MYFRWDYAQECSGASPSLVLSDGSCCWLGDYMMPGIMPWAFECKALSSWTYLQAFSVNWEGQASTLQMLAFLFTWSGSFSWVGSNGIQKMLKPESSAQGEKSPIESPKLHEGDNEAGRDGIWDLELQD